MTDEGQDTVLVEYLVIAVKNNPGEREKLSTSTMRIVEAELTGNDIIEPLERAIVKSLGRPSTVTRYLVVPLDEAATVTLKPTVEFEHGSYQGYHSL